MKIFWRILITLVFAACMSYLVRIVLVPHESSTTEKINPSIIVTVPSKWKRQMDMEPPQHTIILANHSTVWGNIYKKSDIDLDMSDSRRPQYYAKRYAEAWGTTLWKWENPDGTRIFETWRSQKGLTNLIVSVTSQSAEANIVAFVDDKTSQQDVNMSLSKVRQVIHMLLSSSHDETNQIALFPNITTLSPNSSAMWKKLKESKNSNVVEKIGKYKITIPKSWYPSDLNIPSANFTLNLDTLKTPTLNLDHVPTGGYNGTLRMSWLDKSGGMEPFLKFQQSLVVKRPKAIIRHLPISKSAITVYTLDLEKTSKITLYRYKSSDFAFKAQAITRKNIMMESYDTVVRNIINQLILNVKQQSNRKLSQDKHKK